jgi:hypothetical protein
VARAETDKKKLMLAGLLLVLAAGAEISRASDVQDWQLDASLYPYQHRLDDDVDFTAAINGNLPGRFSYFSFMNFRGVTTSESVKLERSEQNLRMLVADGIPLDLNVQAVLAEGSGNDFYQAGVSWRINDTPGWEPFFDRIHVIWRATFHLKRWGTDNAGADAWSLEHFVRITTPQWTDRFYISGFYETTYDLDVPPGATKRPVVTEFQAGLRFWRDFYAVAEYRRNDFRAGNEHNTAVGIEYQVRW